MKKRIYLDHSATTPVDKKVAKKINQFLIAGFGNPSSLHTFGQNVLAAVDVSRNRLAKFLNCTPQEIVFTSGATESDNLAIFGVVKAIRNNNGGRKIHIITSKIEHPAVLEPFHELKKQGVEITFLSVGPDCRVNPEEVKKAIKDNTVLVSIMYVNSEVGSIQPIREIGKIIEKINEDKLKEWQKTRPAARGEKPQLVYFHTDAVQAVNFLNCDVKYLHIDLLSLSGHKIYGPKGIGALYVKSGTPIEPITFGGHQERNLRSGTLNVPAIAGLGKAIEILGSAKEKEKINKKIAVLRDKLVKGIMKKIPNVILNTPLDYSTPAHANFCFVGAEGESILIMLDLEGIAISTGSACASGSLEPSHVLLAMGVKAEIAHSSLRFTLGKNTTKEEIDRVLKVLPGIIKKLRQMAPEL